MDEMLKKYLLEKHGLNTDTLQEPAMPSTEELDQETDRLLSAKEAELAQPQSNQVFPEARPVEQILAEEQPKDVAGEQAEIGSEQKPVSPQQTEQLNKTLNEQDNGKAQEDHAKMIQDPVSYIKEKYKLHPDVSYEELKSVQKKSGILDAIGDFDKSIGGMGDWNLLEAKKGGYTGSYAGGALNKQGAKMKKDFDERLKYQTDEQDRMSKNIGTEKSSLDLAKAGVSFDQMIKDEKELDDANGFLGKMLSDQAKELFGADKIPEGVTPRQLLKVMPSLSEITKSKWEKSLTAQNETAKENLKFGHEKALKQMDLQKAAKAAEAKPSVGEQTTDKEFAKDYANWVAVKGSIGADKSLANLDSALKEMEANKDLTGGVRGFAYGMAPESAKSAISSKIGKIEANLRSAVVDTLRPLLGGQFAEKEGERIMKQTFDPNQPMEENLRRAKLVQADLQNQLESRKKAVEHWENSGKTLKGYKAFDGRQAPTEAPQSKFKAGDVREKNGKKYQRGEDGKWRPISE